MRALWAAVIGVTLAGCTSALPATRPPVLSGFATPEREADGSALAQDAALEAARAAMGSPEDDADSSGELSLEYTPETLHQARIAIAREALVDVSVAKQELDEEEERQREMALRMDADRTAKARLHHGAAHR